MLSMKKKTEIYSNDVKYKKKKSRIDFFHLTQCFGHAHIFDFMRAKKRVPKMIFRSYPFVYLEVKKKKMTTTAVATTVKTASDYAVVWVAQNLTSV